MEIVGRQSSHFTRVVRIFAHELGLEYTLTPIFDLMSEDPEAYAGNPALKLPILKSGGQVIYGHQNICRALLRRAGLDARVVMPEQAGTPLLMNAHETLMHAMAVQVEVVFHEVVEKRPPDAASRKRRRSLVNCLAWLDEHLGTVLGALPERDFSYFEVGLYCLLEHLPFRNPMDISAMPKLVAFVEEFGKRSSAQATPYRFDKTA